MSITLLKYAILLNIILFSRKSIQNLSKTFHKVQDILKSFKNAQLIYSHLYVLTKIYTIKLSQIYILKLLNIYLIYVYIQYVLYIHLHYKKNNWPRDLS